MGQRRTRDEENRQRALSRGWRILQNYQASNNGMEQIEADSDELRSIIRESRRYEVPPYLRNIATNWQAEVVKALRVAMLAWFDFYFLLGEGSVYDRLRELGAGLQASAERLQAVGRDVENLRWNNSDWDDLLMTYAGAAETWASAMDLIARGAQQDRSSMAEHGFNELDRASASAELVVAIGAEPEPGVELHESLRLLEDLQPTERVSKKAIEESKAPWRRALIAAGSRVNWTVTNRDLDPN